MEVKALLPIPLAAVLAAEAEFKYFIHTVCRKRHRISRVPTAWVSRTWTTVLILVIRRSIETFFADKGKSNSSTRTFHPCRSNQAWTLANMTR